MIEDESARDEIAARGHQQVHLLHRFELDAFESRSFRTHLILHLQFDEGRSGAKIAYKHVNLGRYFEEFDIIISEEIRKLNSNS